MPYLIVREPGQVAYLVELEGELIAGRESTCSLVLADKQVSRKHLRLAVERGGWHASDLGSTHGTRVNGQPAPDRALRDGDVLQIGGAVLVFRDGAMPSLGGEASIVRTITGIVEPPERASGDGARRLRALFDVGRVIAALGDPDRAIERVLDMTLDVLACERGMVGLGEGAQLRRIARTRGDVGTEDLVVAPAVLTAMLERKESVLCRAPDGGAGPRSAMGAPLEAAGRVLGYLYVDDRARGDRFGPDDLDFLTALARLAAAALDQAEAHRRASNAAEAGARGDLPSMLGDSDAMKKLRAQIDRCASAGDVAILIHGETGTGKELVAAHLHARSPRADQAFVAVNCAAIPDNLIESELFGVQKGAYTGADRTRRGRFACAHKGTLFLDEIGDLGLAAQAKLLRAIEEGEIQPLGAEQPISVDVRVIAASHKDLAAEVAAGRFREDLYYRLDVVGLEVPPLRARGEDVLLLADTFLHAAVRRLGRPRKELGASARAALLAYGWPGNVRQLQNEIERALLLADGTRIEADDLRLRGGAAVAGPLAERFTSADRALCELAQEALGKAGGDIEAAAQLLGIGASELDRVLAREPDPTVLAEDVPTASGSGDWTPIEDAERQLLERALKASGGNIRAAARALGVARGTLYRKISKYGLAPQ